MSLSLSLNAALKNLSQIQIQRAAIKWPPKNSMGTKMNTFENNTMAFDAISSNAETIFELGMKYCLGREVAQSNIEAHKWFNIAAMKGCEAAKQYRCDIAREMSVSEVAEAQRQARAMLTLH